MKLRIKRHWIIILIVGIFLCLLWPMVDQNQDTVTSPTTATKDSKKFHYFFVNLPNGWEIVSSNYFPQNHSEEKAEEVTFNRVLGDRKFLDISIRVDNEQDSQHQYYTSKKQILLNGSKVPDYTTEDCGGGKGMGSYCEQIILHKNNKRYIINLFDYGSRVGTYKSHALFMDFLRNTSLTIL